LQELLVVISMIAATLPTARRKLGRTSARKLDEAMGAEIYSRFPGLALSALAILAASSSARAASFDGKWIGDVPVQGRCNATATMTLTVTGATIVGQVHNPAGVRPLKGTVEPDGSGLFKVSGIYEGTMRFTPDHFEATWNNGDCERHAEGGRQPDAGQLAALVSARKDHQARYADLMARAKADDKTVDYSQLRAESVYADTWEFYDTRATGLLQEAAAAVKGKDCATGLNQLDQLLKLDFIIDYAHQLKAECLRQTGQGDAARVEQDIADGLTHSLMQSSAGQHTLLRALSDSDGAEVDSAYRVVTYREEMEVLAKRDIQIKTRETEIRGADGHYYDLVKAIAIRGGFGVSIEPKNVYFDVSSFVEGRASVRAAHATDTSASAQPPTPGPAPAVSNMAG
jgi:hypothetical protein